MSVVHFMLLFALPSWIVTSLIPLVLPFIAGIVTTTLHTLLMKATTWYSSPSCPTALHAAIALVIGLLVTLGGSAINGISGGDAVNSTCGGVGSTLSGDCLNALGGLVTSGNITILLTFLLSVGGVLAVKQDRIHAALRATALKAGVTLKQDAK